MKFKKGILLTTLTFIAIFSINIFSGVQAATSSIVTIKTFNLEKMGYTVAEKTIYKIIDTSGDKKSLYCIKAGPGFGSNDMGGSTNGISATSYTNGTAINSGVGDLRKKDNIAPKYKTSLPQNDENYKALIWILDQCYVPAKNDNDNERAKKNKELLLDSVEKYIAQYENEDSDNPKYSLKDLFGTNGKKLTDFIKDTDIIFVQQLAIWHYTNPNESSYYFNNMPTFEADNTVNGPLKKEYPNDEARIRACGALFDYLVQTAKEQSTSYDYTQNGNTSAPVQFDDTKLSIKNLENKDRKIIGPYKIKKIRNDVTYSLQATVTDGNNSEITDIKYVNSDGSAIDNNKNDINNVLEKEFYISVPSTTDTSSVKLNISGSFMVTTLTYWGEKNIDTRSSTAQPVVQIEKEEIQFNDSKTVEEEEKEKKFDLALRKFITNIKGADGSNSRVPENREPNIGNTIKYISGNTTTIEKDHEKTAQPVKPGDIVTYTIRIYNEGELAGWATEVTDYLPEGLEFIPAKDSKINEKYNWSTSNGGRTITTTYLSDKKLEAYNENGVTTNTSEVKKYKGLSYIDLQIECRVIATVGTADKTLKNIAEITEHKAENENTSIVDRDSQPNNVNKGTSYDPKNAVKGLGEEDDDDYEDLILKKGYFDLALRKFITNIRNADNSESIKPEDRVPTIGNTIKNISNTTTIEKDHSKKPQVVNTGDIVTYTIRIYNEGEIAGWATEVKDYLPVGLKFIPTDKSSINAKYGWTESDEGRTVTTTYLKEQDKKLDGYVENGGTSEDGETGTVKKYKGLSYVDLQIECEVTEKVGNADKTLKNIAEITGNKDDQDRTGSNIDRDSQTNNVQKDNYNPPKSEQGLGQQDDDDYEDLVLLGQYFDLSLRKFITNIKSVDESEPRTPDNRVPNISNTMKKVTNTTIEKDHDKTPQSVKTGDIVTYTIRIYNEGGLAGWATEVKDYLPEGLEFISESDINEKYGWEVSDNGRTVTTTYLSGEDKKLDAYKQNGETSEESENSEVKKYKGLSYIDLQIECKVTAKVSTVDKTLKNIAEITGNKDEENHTDVDLDRDSKTGNVEKDTDNYSPKKPQQGLGEEDDDDYEDLILPGQYYDLSLRKFITNIKSADDSEPRTPENRVPTIDETMKKVTDTTIEKDHDKTPQSVKTGDIVTYTIRIYNEGGLAGWATEVKDYLPEGLEFIPVEQSEINKKYGWEVSDNGRTVTTKYLAGDDKKLDGYKQNGETSETGEAGTVKKYKGLSYIDLQIECKVTAKVSTVDKTLKNIAEITGNRDEEGNTDVDLDRDSNTGNVEKDTDKYKPQKPEQGLGEEDDDDYEDLVLPGKYFDLSLRKFISEVTDANNKTHPMDSREPKVDTTPLLDESSTTAIYEHTKAPIGVSNGDIVTYTIRIYNEGQMDGYVTKITDHLPKQLEYIVDDELNAKYGWTVSQDGRTVTTDITSPDAENWANRDSIYEERNTGSDDDKVLLKAFERTPEAELDYIDVKIKCRVKDDIDLYEKITNIAEIAEYTDSSKESVVDRDSTSDSLTNNNSKPEDNIQNDNLPTDENLPGYKDSEIENGTKYIPGQQDDDDFEKLVLQRFDLALRKFITGVISGDNTTDITSRVPVFKKVSDKEFKYEHPKDPVEVANGNIVIYTLRIFNEGNIAGYAKKVKDDLPEGLEFLPDNSVNTAFGWKMYKEDGTETKDVKEAKYIETDFLSKEKEKEEGENLLKAFDTETMTMPDYKDLKIAFKVTEPNTSDRIIINQAQISDDSDEEGNPIEDVDSEPDKWTDGEDDQDTEKVKVKYFDLSLKKWVTEAIVTVDGKKTVTKTGHTGDENPEAPVKVEIQTGKINKTTVKFRFNIKVTNEGEIAGYATELIDYIPDGLKFVAEDNPKWKVSEDGKVTTDQLKDKLLQPGESATVDIVLTWINGKNNMGEKVNWAEISQDKNEFNSPDIDSTPGNNVKGEDDIDQAPVLLSPATGSTEKYIGLSIMCIMTFAGGVLLIRKFVI